MDENEATAILEAELARYRAMSYVDLWDLAEEPRTVEIVGPSGVTYQLEAQAWWDDASRTQYPRPPLHRRWQLALLCAPVP